MQFEADVHPSALQIINLVLLACRPVRELNTRADGLCVRGIKLTGHLFVPWAIGLVRNILVDTYGPSQRVTDRRHGSPADLETRCRPAFNCQEKRFSALHQGSHTR